MPTKKDKRACAKFAHYCFSLLDKILVKDIGSGTATAASRYSHRRESVQPPPLIAYLSKIIKLKKVMFLVAAKQAWILPDGNRPFAFVPAWYSFLWHELSFLSH